MWLWDRNEKKLTAKPIIAYQLAHPVGLFVLFLPCKHTWSAGVTPTFPLHSLLFISRKCALPSGTPGMLERELLESLVRFQSFLWLEPLSFVALLEIYIAYKEIRIRLLAHFHGDRKPLLHWSLWSNVLCFILSFFPFPLCLLPPSFPPSPSLPHHSSPVGDFELSFCRSLPDMKKSHQFSLPKWCICMRVWFCPGFFSSFPL